MAAAWLQGEAPSRKKTALMGQLGAAVFQGQQPLQFDPATQAVDALATDMSVLSVVIHGPQVPSVLLFCSFPCAWANRYCSRQCQIMHRAEHKSVCQKQSDRLILDIAECFEASRGTPPE